MSPQSISGLQPVLPKHHSVSDCVAGLHGACLGPLEALLTVAFPALLAIETAADQQQWGFYTYREAEVTAGRQLQERFLQTGLFRFSRHPNFFAEQSQWWMIFFFGAAAAGSILQVTVLEALLLTVLFIGSTRFIEDISLSKYPEYADYQNRTSAIIPWFPRRTRTAQVD
ncbi:MAG: DUF1295 domain-containing protein [Actinomycetales bacterium]|nr:DUF1295 domain-containing protein [Actinomycetales bacterium]